MTTSMRHSWEMGQTMHKVCALIMLLAAATAGATEIIDGVDQAVDKAYVGARIESTDGTRITLTGSDAYIDQAGNTNAPVRMTKAGDGLSTLDNDMIITAPQLADGFTTIADGGKLKIADRIEDNIGLNSFRVTALGSYSVYGMVDGIVDGFIDQAGIDLVASTGQTYVASTPYYYSSFQDGTAYALTNSGSKAGVDVAGGSIDGVNEDFSFSYWTRNTWDHNFEWVLFAKDNAGNLLQILHQNVNGRIDWNWRAGGDLVSFTLPAGYNTGWHHHVFLWDHTASTAHMYVDGAAIGSPQSMSTVDTIAGDKDFRIAIAEGDSEVRGTFDEFWFWKSLLTAEQITNMYNGGAGVYGNSANSPYDTAYLGFHFDEGTGTATTDASGNGNTGAATGGDSAFTWTDEDTLVESPLTQYDMVLVSEEFLALAEPDTMRVLFSADPTTNAVSPNTNLIARVSRDGGTTMTAVDLSYQGIISDTLRIYSGIADVSAQPAGTNLVYEIVATNSLLINIVDASLTWN